jgi:hypothetical protein
MAEVLKTTADLMAPQGSGAARSKSLQARIWSEQVARPSCGHGAKVPTDTALTY